MRAVLAVLLLFTSVAIPQAHAQQENPEIELVNQPCDIKTAARVFVSAVGVVSLNGKVITIDSLLVALQKLPIRSVCYSRENPEAFEPHPFALDVLGAVRELKLPIAFYWDADFQQRVHFKE